LRLQISRARHARADVLGLGLPEKTQREEKRSTSSMATHRLVVFTQPKPGQEAEYNRWYEEVHLGDVLKVEGFVAAQRFEVATAQIGDAAQSAPGRYLAIYEIEAENLEAALAQLSAGSDSMEISDALDAGQAQAIAFTAIGERKLSS